MPPFNVVSDHLFEGKVRRNAKYISIYSCPYNRDLLSETTNVYIIKSLDTKETRFKAA